MEWYVIRRKDNAWVRVVRADKLKLGKNHRVICVCGSQQSAIKMAHMFCEETGAPTSDLPLNHVA